MTVGGSPVLLGTVAIEPNRWGRIRAGRTPTTSVADWLTRIAAAGFDGVELWESHATQVPVADLDRLLGGVLPIVVFNSYASWDEPDPGGRDLVAEWVCRLGASAVKFNVGADAAARDRYVERLQRFDERVDPGVRLLCECHAGTIADVPGTAAAMFDEVAPAPRLQAIVHLGRTVTDSTRAFMEGLGDRVGHVHVQLHDQAPDTDPAALAADLRDGVEYLRTFGFRGTWTIEFSYGPDTDRDEPGLILECAARDLRALRDAFDDSTWGLG